MLVFGIIHTVNAVLSFLCDAGTDTGTILAFVPKCKTSIKVKYVAIVNHKFHYGDWISCMKSTYIVKNFQYSTVSNTFRRVFLRQHQQNDLFQIFYQVRVCSMFIVIHVMVISFSHRKNARGVGGWIYIVCFLFKNRTLLPRRYLGNRLSYRNGSVLYRIVLMSAIFFVFWSILYSL